MYDEEPTALGFVPVEGRGSLPYALVHGESLVAAASWALTTAGIELLDWGVGLEAVRESGRVLVVHDPLCPLTPVEFLESAVAECERTGAVVVGVRPVTDTVKEHDVLPEGPDVLGATVDRDALMCVVSPLVLPSTVVPALEELGVEDLARTVAELVVRAPVRYLPAPALARRVSDLEDLEVLEALSSALQGGRTD